MKNKDYERDERIGEIILFVRSLQLRDLFNYLDVPKSTTGAFSAPA